MGIVGGEIFYEDFPQRVILLGIFMIISTLV